MVILHSVEFNRPIPLRAEGLGVISIYITERERETETSRQTEKDRARNREKDREGDRVRQKVSKEEN